MFQYLCDPDTASKMQIVGPKGSLELLHQYIDGANIPAFLGGSKIINGDTECRLQLAPGGPPPEAALTRLRELLSQKGHLAQRQREMVQTSDIETKYGRWCCG